MDICCINPPIQDFYCTSVRRQPLGLLYIIAALEQAGHTITFINAHTPKKHTISLPNQFEYLIPFMESNDTNFRFPYKKYSHYGASFEEIQRAVKSCSAKIYFIACLFTTYYQETSEIISIIRKTKKNAIIVTGGYHAALYPEFYLNTCGADYVITGEGEHSAVTLIDYLAGKAEITKVPNLCYLDGKNIIRTNIENNINIDSIHFPARDKLIQRDFRFYRKKGISMITSRGCPNKCDFCTSRDLWGSRYRIRSISSVIDEIDSCVSRYNVALINFEDDNLMASPGHTKELLVELHSYQKRRGISLDLTAMNGLSLENIDEETILLMRQAGFSELNISLVSHSDNILKAHRRPFDSIKVKLISGIARSYGLRVRAYFILGLPEQTQEEIETTIKFLNDINVMLFPSVFYDVKRPETEWKMQRSSAFYNETQFLTRKNLLYFFNTALLLNKNSYEKHMF